MKLFYEMPTLEVLEILVESGFVASGDFTMPDGENNGDEQWA